MFVRARVASPNVHPSHPQVAALLDRLPRHTVIGFIIALSGVDPATASEVENVQAMVSTLITGMSVAMYTTLVGAVLYVWLNVNHRILVTGTVDLIDATIELGESRARA